MDKFIFKIIKTAIPENSLMRKFMPEDYVDSFRLSVNGIIEASPDDTMVNIWLDMPGWVDMLFKFRKLLARVVGLKGDGKNPKEFEKYIREGGKYGFVEVAAKNADETLLIMRDRHLDAYMSVLKDGRDAVCVNTLVRYNNSWGKIYFFFIRPFHSTVIRSSLKRAVKKHVQVQ